MTDQRTDELVRAIPIEALREAILVLDASRLTPEEAMRKAIAHALQAEKPRV